MKRRVRIGAAARRRVRRGGKLAVGRPSETLAGWKLVKAEVRVRAGGRCEVHRSHRGTDFHHVIARSAGGADSPENVVLLCRRAHEQISAPYSRGRLWIYCGLNGAGFGWYVIRAGSKAAWVSGVGRITQSGFIAAP